ncbi:MAG TPA: DJ-1/PfpI family protein [Devosiaceae bacterium]|jgi:putative intracellular protease/amidase|nr:DJ-1/PfpI family protein [Devosiaceae bacterium]
MRSKRTRLIIAGIATTFALVAAFAPFTFWRTPDNVARASAPAYAEGPPRLRAKENSEQPLVVVVVADNAGTETTDFIVPYGMLKESGIAEVRSLSSEPGVVELMPALRVEADETIADFDATEPRGADVVIVPAMHRQDNPVILDFLQRQAELGALIVSICDGAWVVANAGLFDGRKATGHWFSFDDLARKFPHTTWVKDARIVSDGQVMSTTGVSASIPVSLTIIEALADRATAARLAQRFGIDDWNGRHDSDAFGVSAPMLGTGLSNLASFWSHEELAVEVSEGFDEIAFALQADAWSRTYRSTLVAVNGNGEIESARGLRLIAEPVTAAVTTIPLVSREAEAALDETLSAIERRYGGGTAEFVAVQLEYQPAS